MKVTRIVLYSEMAAHGFVAIDSAISLIESKWFKTSKDKQILALLKSHREVMEQKKIEIKNFHKMAHAKLFWNKEEKKAS